MDQVPGFIALPGETIVSLSASGFRVVRVFRGSKCFFLKLADTFSPRNVAVWVKPTERKKL